MGSSGLLLPDLNRGWTFRLAGVAVLVFCAHFVAAGFVPLSAAEESVTTVDETEAVRLADLEGFYQEEAAQRMNISRQTFGRIVSSARGKIAEAIIQGKALRIEGGNYIMSAKEKR